MHDPPESLPAPTDLAATIAELGPDPVVAIDGLGTVVWANDEARWTFGGSDQQLVGTNAFDWVHPDDHEPAANAIAASLLVSGERSGRAVLAPAPYRLRLANGSYGWYEIAGKPHPDLAGGTVIVASLRDIGRQQRLTRAVELIAGGAPLHEIVHELLLGVDYVEPRRTSGFSWTDGNHRRVATITLPPELVWTDHPDDPWNQAIATGDTVGVIASELRPELRALAAEVNLSGCAAVPVMDPASSVPGCLVVWADHEAVVDSLQVRAHRTADSLLRLALVQRHERRQLVHAATHDALTGLLNRRALLQQLHDLEASDTPVSLLFCDLDEFKPVNDDQGHEAGDRVLGIVADRLSSAVRAGDLVGRIGGDEFAIVAVGLTDDTAVAALADRVLAAVSQPIALEIGGDARVVRVGISIGVAVPEPPGPRSPDTLLAAADDAMYAAKRAGRARWHRAAVATPSS